VDVLDVTLLVTGALERCGIDYFLGGSLATSFQGEPRATNDVDLVVALAEGSVAPLVAALGPDFEVDVEALRRTAREGGSWNVIYAPLVTKIDLFMRGTAPYDLSEFERRRRVEPRAGRSLFIKSPEDSVLRKLLWYRAGGSVSDRQWRDVVEVLRHSAPLDIAYLDTWADRLALSALLARARRDAAR
jgi:hypothetical protein